MKRVKQTTAGRGSAKAEVAMDTISVKRVSGSPQAQCEFEDATSQSWTRDQGSTAALVAMIACNVMLLLMLAACSPPAHAQVLARQASGVDARAFSVAVPMGRLTVVPSPEDLAAPAKGRWQRFNETLDAAARSRHHRIIESATNNGIRMSCYEPCLMNCCVTSGEFSLAGRGFGR